MSNCNTEFKMFGYKPVLQEGEKKSFDVLNCCLSRVKLI
jgi:hypothetical protein